MSCLQSQHDTHVSQLMPTQYLLLFEALSMVKISIVLLYMRLSNFASLKWKIINWTILFILISHMIASFFVHLFMCKPAGVFWNLVRIGELSSPPVCQDQSKSYAILNSFHILTDFSLFAVPVAMLWKVQMHWAKKLQICIAGLVGLTSCAFAIMRTISSYRVVLSQPMCKFLIIHYSRTHVLRIINRLTNSLHRVTLLHHHLGARGSHYRCDSRLPPCSFVPLNSTQSLLS